MRISFGKFKGYQVRCKSNSNIRPSLSRVRDVLFNTLGDISNLIFIDLFAGTGIVGFEAVSLGCKLVIFVDKRKILLKDIHHNLVNFKVNNYKLINSNYIRAINILEMENIRPDIIFCDPPYKLKAIYKNILLESENITDNGSVVVLEKSKDNTKIESNIFELIKIKEISNTQLLFYRRKP